MRSVRVQMLSSVTQERGVKFKDCSHSWGAQASSFHSPQSPLSALASGKEELSGGEKRPGGALWPMERPPGVSWEPRGLLCPSSFPHLLVSLDCPPEDCNSIQKTVTPREKQEGAA